VAPPVRLMTHLACADERDAGSRMRSCNVPEALGDLPGERSVANSAGLLWRERHARGLGAARHHAVRRFAVRRTQAGAELGLRPAMELMSTMIALRTVRRGERVGYGGIWTAREDSRIAIAAIGYGDGLSAARRCSFAGGARPWRVARAVLAAARRYSCAAGARHWPGRVSMDMIAST
jgi:alanine racemase